MMNQNKHTSPVETALSALEEAAFDSAASTDSDAPRDTWWWRWLKFAAVVIIPAIVLGVGFLFEDHIQEIRAGSSYEREVAARRVQRDTVGSMKFRFWIGACLGGGVGAIYVGRCVLRKSDP